MPPAADSAKPRAVATPTASQRRKQYQNRGKGVGHGSRMGTTFVLDDYAKPEGCGNGMDPSTNHIPQDSVSEEPLEATQRQLSFTGADGETVDSPSVAAATPPATTPPAAPVPPPAATVPAPPADPKPAPVPEQSSTTPTSGVYDDGIYWKFLCLIVLLLHGSSIFMQI